jgi:adenine-specific DNA-methyltransferase
MRAQGTPLSEWNLSINYGIKTGFNDAFIVTTEKKDELIAADPKSAEIIRPILRGRDIKRYNYTFANLWLINVHNGIKSKNIPPINIDDYPAIKEHLNIYYSKLSKRADKGDTPYNLRNCVYMNDFYEQKIVWGNLCLSAQFTLADEGYFINAPSPMIVPGNKYVLAVLNSRLGDWYIRQLGVTRNGGYFEYKPMFVEQLPVPSLPESEQSEYIALVDKVILAKNSGEDSSRLEEEINCLVYELYGLTETEIEFIRST